jgi:hypothetical protein
LNLERLRESLLAVGFKVHEKAPLQAALRVYVNGHKYPLLNPRFEASAEPFGVTGHKASLVFTVSSRGLGDRFDRALTAFPSTDQCALRPDARNHSRGYRLHGYFLLPLRFSGEHSEDKPRAQVKGGLR